ncbi:hypothetical protein Ciccas_005788 [Cichlidogyrus casuarinus]|uniref:Uncharacterized protein n=1 Tax=Cichlidogyrus casuarinus TaxID=1844966 RepID=A0ABD2Q7N6_9PLAT
MLSEIMLFHCKELNRVNTFTYTHITDLKLAHDFEDETTGCPSIRHPNRSKSACNWRMASMAQYQQAAYEIYR